MRTAGLWTALMVVLVCADVRGQQSGQVQGSSQNSANFQSDADLTLEPRHAHGMWQDDLGEGFRQGAMEFEGTIGGGLGIRDSRVYRHDLALAELRVGRVVSKIMGEGHWYRGNFEMLGELFVGSQISPEPRYLVGVAPVLRYELATGTRWVPFVDLSAGLSATDIGHPDLGSNFEFDLQGGPGLKYYFGDEASIILQYRYLHFSNAGLFPHNHGINVNMVLIGMSWMF